METFVTKVQLSTGKVVFLREPKIADTDLATQAASIKVKSDNTALLSMAIQKELIKQLVVKVNETQPKASELEDLDKWFTMREYVEVGSVVSQITGLGDPVGNLKTEQVKFGAQ